jgi:hypothetical protein
LSRSRASGPRTSPTTMRSGRSRSVDRTKSDSETDPDGRKFGRHDGCVAIDLGAGQGGDKTDDALGLRGFKPVRGRNPTLANPLKPETPIRVGDDLDRVGRL